MKFNHWMLAGMVSAFLIAGPATAQVKKPAVSKSASPGRAKPTPGQAGTSVKPTATPQSKANPPLTSSQDSISYSIGMAMAQNLKQNGMTELNNALLTQGLNDALSGGQTRLTMEQMGSCLNAYGQKQMALRNADNEKNMAEAKKLSAENKKVGDAFLAENKTKPGVKTTDSGLQYLVEKEGTGPKPTATDRVKVHYAGRLLDGTEFDSSVKRGQPAEFGVGEVIKGWTEALQLMPVGSKWKLFIPADLAYGDRAMGPDIKPGSTLVFDLELLDIVK